MPSTKKGTSQSGDSLEVISGIRPFDASPTAWLVGQGIHYLNSAGKESEQGYQHVVELLRRCGRGKEILEAVKGIFRQVRAGDAPLRWSLLHIIGDAGDPSASDFLVEIALKKLPEVKEKEGCEGPRDAEMLVSTMAVHALRRIAGRHPEVSEKLLKVVSERPARPILIEAVKVADELELTAKVRELLPKEDHWILKIRRVRTEDLIAEPERDDGKERVFTPPTTGLRDTSPQVACCSRRSG